MESKVPNIQVLGESRRRFLRTVLGPDIIQSIDKNDQSISPNGDESKSQHEASEGSIRTIAFANALADLSNENSVLTKALVADPAVSSLQDIARKYNTKKLVTLAGGATAASQIQSVATPVPITVSASASTDVTSGSSETTPPEILAFQRKLFCREPSATIARMVEQEEIHVASPTNVSPSSNPTSAISNPIQDGVVKFFDNNPAFNLRQTSILSTLSNPKALDGVHEDHQPAVIATLKTLQTAQALTSTHAALPSLVKSGMTSAFKVAQMPERNFVANFGAHLGGEEVARQIHTHATNTTIRNDQALTAILQTARGSGIAMIDGRQTKQQRLEIAKETVAKLPDPVDLETLFGNMDYCECDDCNSVTSPAAYFVELLQYLRNNNLDPKAPLQGQPGWQGTPLEVLLQRRPDLANLELTCANSNTVLPYIDLANEVMESFIVHLQEYANSPDPKIAEIDVYNATPDLEGLGGSSAEVLAQPQNTNLQAYCILKDAVYPATKLPFNQPVEAIRLFLDFLATSRAEIGQIFRGTYLPPAVTVEDKMAPTCTPAGGYGNPPDSSTGSGDYGTGVGVGDKPSKHTPMSGVYEDYNQNTEIPTYTGESGGNGVGKSDYFSHGAYGNKDVTKSKSSKELPQSSGYAGKQDHGYCDDSHDDSSDCSDCADDDSSDCANTTSFQAVAISDQDQNALRKLHEEALDRSDDAEQLLLTEEEYIILTKQAFWPKQHFDIRYGTQTPVSVYQQRIGVKQDYQYWGVDYHSTDQMLSLDDTLNPPIGLTFVKKQFLPRTGIQYAELVDLLKTEFINPYMPKGRDEVIMEAFRVSYRWMQHQIVSNACHKRDKYVRIVDFLENDQWRAAIKQLGSPDVASLFESANDGSCREHRCIPCKCRSGNALLNWLCKNFERMGKIIVLESGLEQARLEFEANLKIPAPPRATPNPHLQVSLAPGTQTVDAEGDGPILGDPPPVEEDPPVIAGRMLTDGRIVKDVDGVSKTIATVSLDGEVLLEPNEDNFSKWYEKYPNTTVNSIPDGKIIGTIDKNSMLVIERNNNGRVRWLGYQDDCDLSKVRLRHLDGSSVCLPEYDRIHRFLRLWRKLGWTMAELDAALRVLGKPATVPSTTTPVDPPAPDPAPIDSVDIDWADFQDSCQSGTCGQQNCRRCCKANSSNEKSKAVQHHSKKTKKLPGPTVQAQITPEFLHEIVSLKKLVELTGIDLLKILAFFGPIDTYGSPSPYAQLFLTHNMLGVDTIFKADLNGNYLAASPPVKLSDHIPIILAAFQLKPADFTDLLSKIKISDQLTLENVSTLYRYVLLSKVLGVKPAVVDGIFETLKVKAWSSARDALKMVQLWNKIGDAGFTFPQLNYVFTSKDDDPLRPVGPSQRILLQATMSLYTGLNDIEAQHPFITDINAATSATVLTNVQLLYSADVGAQILAFLEGKLPIVTTAPASLVLSIPTELAAKVKYADGDKPALQVTGLLTENETSATKALSAAAGWSKAVDRIAKRAATFLKSTLSGVFPPEAQDAAKTALLQGDVAAPTDPNAVNHDTSPAKRLFFLLYFIPYLRKKLADKLVVDTMSAATSLDATIVQDLLVNVIHGTQDDNVTALDALKKIKDDPKPSESGWTGYLIPPATDNYTLVAESDEKPSDLLLEGTNIPFDVHSDDDDPPDRWASNPLRLTGGRLYKIKLQGLLPASLKWKTDRTQVDTVPQTALLGDHVTDALTNLFVVLYKCAIIINGLSLTDEEVLYLWKHGGDFDNFDWNKIGLVQWNRVADYVKLKQGLPKLQTTLIDLFTWTSSQEAKAGDDLWTRISNITLWPVGDIKTLVSSKNFNLDDPANFRNEVNLVKLKKAYDVSIKVGVGIDLLFTWAQPRIDFWKNHDIAESIRNSIRSRYKLSDWEIAIKPVYDKLRQSQNNALVAYLIVQPELLNEKVVDADSLFEFFLIDVQMCPCMETSRMKQATSSVQLFIQRCMLGLENNNGVPVNALDRKRWDWMQRYRVWEANRKVYLYPENWIQPSLRDDKSPIYLQLESELMQKDTSTASVLEIMKNYLFKLDEVANLEVDALHVEEVGDSKKFHIFARTRQAPYKFFYRFYDTKAKTWQPWQDMQVDIPHYEVEKPKKGVGQGILPPGQGRPNGFYLVPFTFNGRLIVGIPQFMKVQLQANVAQKKIAEIGNNDLATDSLPQEYWEIKMGLSELRKGKWTAKQVTADTISQIKNIPAVLPPIGSFQFITRRDDDPNGPQVVIDVYAIDSTAQGGEAFSTTVGRFSFTGGQFGVHDEPVPLLPDGLLHYTDFQFQRDRPPAEVLGSRVMFPLQGPRPAPVLEYDEGDPMVKYPLNQADRSSMITYDGNEAQQFFHPFSNDLLSRVQRTDNLDDLFKYFQVTWAKWSDGTAAGKEQKFNSYGGHDDSGPTHVTYNELSRPYSLYNWELGFHGPMTLVDRLLQNQQFDLALQICHYVFNPLSDGLGDMRFWQWKPFSEIDAKTSLEQLFADLRPNTAQPAEGPINQWRDNPFQPHVVARQRPVAYMKYVVMKYIEILIAYSDYYFRQNTLEMIPMAIQCYVLASHIYGPKGQKIPKRGKKTVQTFKSLVDKWDAFDNAMIQLELSFPFSNQIDTPVGATNGVVGLANIFGFATTLYFCVPDNPQLRALRDTIDDRLFKIRHCQDITGVVRKLPLYEPSIDPGLLVAATAAGLSLSSVLNDLNSPLPNFRFKPLLQKAIQLCNELKLLGAAFLKAKQKKDCEALMILKHRHHSTIQNLVIEEKKLGKEESEKALDSLHQTRKAPEYRMSHNVKLLGEDLGNIPSIADAESAFNELVDQIEAPIVDSGMKLIAAEKEEIEKAIAALDLKPIINAIETAASELHVLPTLNGHASPFGVGIASCWGPPNIAKGIQGAAKAYQMVSDWLSHQGQNVSRKQTYVKQNQQRVKEANTAGHEVKAIDKHILTQQVRVAVTQQEIDNQQAEIDHAQELEDFLKDKYTKQELYQWMEQSISTLYYQTYTTAYDWAKKAEAAFRFERGLQASESNIIKFGYWESTNDGLLSGERLFLGLKELESAYHSTRGYDFEISKFVSLKRINPLGLLKLRDSGTVEFAVPEVLFDMDFPGHYHRRLRSVAVTIQCTTPQFTNVNCTLRLMSHKFRFSPLGARGKADYPEKQDAEDPRFSTTHIPISSIAVSTAQNDAGVFELDFQGDRFMPFEGAGAISSWRLELNDAFRQFDYDTITDVVLTMQYTAKDGGQALGIPASAAVQDYISTIADLSTTEGLYATFDIPHDFPAAWETYLASTDEKPVLRLDGLNEHLPVYTKGRAPERIIAKDVWVVTDASLSAGDVSVEQNGNVVGFQSAQGVVGGYNAVRSQGEGKIGNWAVRLGDGGKSVKVLWILIRYSLK